MNNDNKSSDATSEPKYPIESIKKSTTYFLLNTLASLILGVSGGVAETIAKLRSRRMAYFIQHLVDRIDNVEELANKITQPACLELLEEASDQAIKGENDFRRYVLARLMSSSINDDLKNHEIDRLLLAMLKELTDYEFLHLLSNMSSSWHNLDNEYMEIVNGNDEITYPRRSVMDSDQSELDAYAAQMAHKSRLESHGLFVNKGDIRNPRYETTPLARLLLRRIGALPENS